MGANDKVAAAFHGGGLDKAIEAATKRVTAETLGAEWSRSIARLAVEAAAPFIAAQALYEAADHLEYGNPVFEFLNTRAEKIEEQS